MTVKIATRNLFLSLTLLLLSGCAMQPATPENTGESFVLERDLVGKTIATGSFSAIDGTFREFIAHIDGSWDGKAVTLVEDFEYSDGEKERKTWILTKLPNGEFSGVREDVVGTARGYQDGKAFRMEYSLALPNEDGSTGRKMKFRDVLVNDTEGNIINKATVGWWGIRVATVDLEIKRADSID